MRICFFIKKEKGFYATYASIRFNALDKAIKSQMIIDYYEDIQFHPPFDYIIHCKSGVLFKDVSEFISSLPKVSRTTEIHQIDFPNHIYTLKDDVLPQEYTFYNYRTENALWVLNNHPEQLKFWHHHKFVAPASGTMWMLQMINPIVDDLQLIDISTAQIDFANQLLKNWDGDNYGKFTVNFIKTLTLKNVHICQSFNSYQEYLDTINNDVKLENIINEKFFEVMPADFAKQWQQNKSKKIEIINDNILKYINPDDKFVWGRVSCLNYKYTILNTNDDLLDKFSAFTRINNTWTVKFTQ